MSKSTSIRLDNDHEDALDRMVKRGDADSPSEALRQTSQRDLARRGYLTGNGPSPLAKALDTVGLVCGIIGLVWVAVTFLYPVEVRIWAVSFMLASVLAYSGKRLITSDNTVTWLRGVIGRGEKA